MGSSMPATSVPRSLRATLAVGWAAAVCVGAVAAPHPGTPDPGTPVRAVAAAPATPLAPAPAPGAHNEDVYHGALGLAPADLDELRAAGVI